MTKLSLACGVALSVALVACSSTPPAGQSATGSTPAPAATTAASTASTKGPKLVCEDSSQMGSHFKSHICLTPEQVEARRKEAQQAAQDFQNRAHPVSADGKPPV
jgi:hypothetical protein